MLLNWKLLCRRKKISDLVDKQVAKITKFNILKGKVKKFMVRLLWSDTSNLIKNSDLKTKLSILATKAELKAEQDKIVKLQTYI